MGDIISDVIFGGQKFREFGGQISQILGDILKNLKFGGHLCLAKLNLPPWSGVRDEIWPKFEKNTIFVTKFEIFKKKRSKSTVFYDFGLNRSKIPWRISTLSTTMQSLFEKSTSRSFLSVSQKSKSTVTGFSQEQSKSQIRKSVT